VRRHGTRTSMGAATMAIEYRSQRTWRGMPLVHVAFGQRLQGMPYRPGRAHGVIAVGDQAAGIVAVGAVALGVVAVGPVAIGLAAVGAVALGLVAAGAVAVGSVAVGAVAVGLVAIGAVAVGLSHAIGAVMAGGGASR
jgi:hypothetical protein